MRHTTKILTFILLLTLMSFSVLAQDYGELVIDQPDVKVYIKPLTKFEYFLQNFFIPQSILFTDSSGTQIGDLPIYQINDWVFLKSYLAYDTTANKCPDPTTQDVRANFNVFFSPVSSQSPSTLWKEIDTIVSRDYVYQVTASYRQTESRATNTWSVSTFLSCTSKSTGALLVRSVELYGPDNKKNYYVGSIPPADSTCTPSTEVCDGKDNDCDDQVDEDCQSSPDVVEPDDIALTTIQILRPETTTLPSRSYVPGIPANQVTSSSGLKANQIGVRLDFYKSSGVRAKTNFEFAIYPRSEVPSGWLLNSVVANGLFVSCGKKDTTTTCPQDNNCEMGFVRSGSVDMSLSQTTASLPLATTTQGWYILEVPGKSSTFSNKKSAYDANGDYVVVAYTYDYCFFQNSNAKIFSVKSKPLAITYADDGTNIGGTIKDGEKCPSKTDWINDNTYCEATCASELCIDVPSSSDWICGSYDDYVEILQDNSKLPSPESNFECLSDGSSGGGGGGGGTNTTTSGKKPAIKQSDLKDYFITLNTPTFQLRLVELYNLAIFDSNSPVCLSDSVCSNNNCVKASDSERASALNKEVYEIFEDGINNGLAILSKLSALNLELFLGDMSDNYGLCIEEESGFNFDAFIQGIADQYFGGDKNIAYAVLGVIALFVFAILMR